MSRPDDENSTQDRSRTWALLATSLGFGVVQLDVSVVNVAVRSIGEDLGGSVTSLQWVVNAYTVAFAALILSAGALGDRIGARRVFVSGFVAFVAASAGCALAPSIGVLIAARAVQGIGAAVLVPCSLSLLNHAYSDAQERGRAVGLWAAGASVALSAGPLVGGILISVWGWRAIFFINLPLGALAIALTILFARETPRADDRGIDFLGQTLAGVTLVCLATAMVQGGHASFGAPIVVVGFAISVVAGAAFVLVERRRRQPMLPPKLFTSRTFSAATAMGLVINVAFYGLIFVLSLYFQTARHYSALQTGLAFAPATVAVLVGNVTAGRLSERYSPRSVLLCASALMAVGLLGLLPAGDQTSYLQIAPGLVVVGLALGFIVPIMTSALLGSVDTSWSGVASGTLNTARQSGSVVGVAFFGSLAAGSIVRGLRVSTLISIGLALTCLLLALVIKSGSASETTDDDSDSDSDGHQDGADDKDGDDDSSGIGNSTCETCESDSEEQHA